MPEFKIVMPKLGESISEATITKWFVKEGDKIADDDVLLEIATDKVDSEIPSPVSGKISKIFFQENDKVLVGTVIALILLEGSEETESIAAKVDLPPESSKSVAASETKNIRSFFNKFYSPLVKSIANQENISIQELESINGSGNDGRVSKQDLLTFIENRSKQPKINLERQKVQVVADEVIGTLKENKHTPLIIGDGDEVIEMDRVKRMIADHMVMSKHVAPHVTTMVEADVTHIVLWREKMLREFASKSPCQ